jgi:hypothetical protein
VIPNFSIVTVTKDSGPLFARTSDSIASLSCSDYEWIVVDGSRELSSIDIVDSCCGGRAILIRGKDTGIAHAFNLGITASSGRFVVLLNAGDTYSSDFLCECLKSCSDTSILCGSAKLVSTSTKAVGRFIPKPRALWRGMHVPHNWMCVPRRIYSQIGLYRHMPHAMDYEWCKRVLSVFGPTVFRCLPTDRDYGTYLLGGHSDVGYYLGLSASRSINIEYGMNRAIAWFIYGCYAAKRSISFL